MLTAQRASTGGPAGSIRQGEISMLLATRGRPELLAESLETLKAHTARKDRTVLWAYVDEDDEVTRRAIEAGKMPDPGLTIHWHIGPRTPGLGETHQAMWNASGRASEVYMISSDKANFETPGWDDVIRSKFAEYPDGALLAYAHDPNTADQATYPILGWGWLNAVGYFFPGYFPFWFDDKWVDEIGRMADRYVKLPLVIGPLHGRGRTQRMRGMPFWVRFFQLTLCERKEAATRLISAIYPKDEKGRQQALAAMEQRAATFAKLEDQYSDLYATFQEERHTAVSPEDRDRFDPLYFKQEARAVERLIVLAQQCVAQKQWSEALKFLDGTLLSELRVRGAQTLRVECLRGLGRQKEADRLAKETIEVWPQMALARRFFRFAGMFANEAKRLLVKAEHKEKQRF
jgi:hypothetical protein